MTDLSNLVSEQFLSLPPQARVVILHPNFAQQHRLLTQILMSGEYVRLTGKSMDADGVWSLVQKAGVEEKLGRTSAVVIDEADRADGAALATIVLERLLPRMKKGRIILMGRSLPTDVLHHEALDGKAVLLPIASEHMLTDYSQRTDQRNVLEVWGLGSGRVMVNGRQIDNWDGVLPRALFFYLIDRGMTTRSEIFQHFWPTLNVREATNVFHVTKRKVNEVLGTDLTEFKASYYFLAPNIQLHYDVSRFNHCVQESADAEPEEAERLLREAVAMVRSPFVATLQVPWVQKRRGEITIAFTDALLALGRLVESRGDAEDALSWYLRAFRQSPSRPDVVERLLDLCRETGHALEGKEIYKRHRNALATEEYKKVSDGVRRAASALS